MDCAVQIWLQTVQAADGTDWHGVGQHIGKTKPEDVAEGFQGT